MRLTACWNPPNNMGDSAAMSPRSDNAALQDLQQDFASSLIQASRAIPDDVTSHNTRHPEKRFNVYRNNVFASLIDVLAGRFPAVQRLVGEEFFRGTVAEFIRTNPPDNPVIIRYGAAFPDFLDGFEPVDDVPYLADVARLEMAWNTAYHAADAAALTPQDFAAIAPEQVAQLVLRLHPSLTVLRSSYPVLTIWQKNTEGGDGDMASVNFAEGGEDVMIVRPQRRVNLIKLEPAAHPFITALAGGKRLGAAVDAAIAANPAFDFSATLASLMRNGAICAFEVKPV